MASLPGSLLSLIIAMILSAMWGCSSKQADTRSALQHFKDEQAATVTPHGRIMMETVKELDSSSFLYQTEDGKHWAVQYSKRADGTYEYCTPEETK
jgi:hypothetical protein